MYLPGILMSLSIAYYVSRIVRFTLKLALRAHDVSHNGGTRRRGVRSRLKSLLRVWVFKILNPVKVSLMVMAVGCSLLFLLQIVSSVYLFPQLGEFGDAAMLWGDCVRLLDFCREMSAAEGFALDPSQTNCETYINLSGPGEGCGERPTVNPSHTVMVLHSLSRGLLPLVVGVSFSLPKLVQYAKEAG